MERWCSMVVFDMAGTTVRDEDNAVASSVQKALAEFGCDITLEAVDPVMGMPKPLAIRSLLDKYSRDDSLRSRSDEVHTRFQQIVVDHYKTGSGVAEVPGTSRVFRLLRDEGIKVAIDTGFDRLTLDTIVNRLGWDGMLDASVASGEVENGRPAPDMIEVLMDRVGVSDSSTVCKVGDSVSDIEQGLNAGCGLVAAVLCQRTKDEYQRYGGVIAVESIDELLPHLGLSLAGAAG
ncbi:MAG: HAD hydrolase-like protein [Leptolyngbya sp. SIO3F4]|nr:HAD hydrolase-like protein [Leptolyngbya sp. SIO3F4]